MRLSNANRNSKRLHFYLLFLIVVVKYTNAGYLTDKDDVDPRNLSIGGDDTYGKCGFYCGEIYMILGRNIDGFDLTHFYICGKIDGMHFNLIGAMRK